MDGSKVFKRPCVALDCGGPGVPGVLKEVEGKVLAASGGVKCESGEPMAVKV